MPARVNGSWGGARNRADRTSKRLTKGQVELLTGGAWHSGTIGLPLNRHIIVQFKLMGIAERDTLPEVRLILKKSGDWIAANGGQFAAIWSREVGPNKGAHLHLAAHIPDGLAVRYFQMLRRWLRRRLKVDRWKGGTILTRCIKGAPKGPEMACSALYRVNLWKVASYLAKGSSPALVASYGLTHDYKPGGTVTGKRAGTTANLGRAARGLN
jgi:hypothetical protein